MQFIFNLLLVLLLLLACLGMGLLISRALDAVLHLSLSHKERRNAEPQRLNFVVGSGFLSIIWQLLALSGQLTAAFLWLVFAVCAVVGLYSLSISHPIQDVSKSIRSLKPSIRRLDLVLLFACCVVLILWYGTLAYVRPPFGDADAFYMTYAKIIAATGHISPMPGNYHDFSSIGLSGELHYAAIMALGGATGAVKLFAWGAGINMVFVLLAIVRLCGGGQLAQLFSVLLVLTSTTVTDYLSDGKTDLFAASLALGAVYYALVAAQSNIQTKMIILSGFLTGLAFVAKLSLIVVMVPSIATILFFSLNTWSAFRQKNVSQMGLIAGQSMLFGAAAILAAMPHLLKNYLLFNNAFAPFFGGSANWATASSVWYSTTDTIWIVLTYPLALVYGFYPLMGGNISFLWFAALPIIFIFKWEFFKSNKSASLVMCAGIVGLAAWLVLKPSILAPRYILPVLLMLIPLPMIAIERLFHSESRPKIVYIAYLSLAFIASVSALYSPPAGVWTAKPKKVIAHIRNGGSECGLSISSYCDGFDMVNKSMLAGDRVFLGGYYSYHLAPDLLQCVNTREENGKITSASTAEIWQTFFEQGFTFVAIQRATHASLLDKLDITKAPDWLDVSVNLADSNMPIYQLRSSNPAYVSQKTCRLGPQGRSTPDAT